MKVGFLLLYIFLIVPFSVMAEEVKSKEELLTEIYKITAIKSAMTYIEKEKEKNPNEDYVYVTNRTLEAINLQEPMYECISKLIIANEDLSKERLSNLLKDIKTEMPDQQINKDYNNELKVINSDYYAYTNKCDPIAIRKENNRLKFENAINNNLPSTELENKLVPLILQTMTFGDDELEELYSNQCFINKFKNGLNISDESLQAIYKADFGSPLDKKYLDDLYFFNDVVMFAAKDCGLIKL